jgi:serine/threonine-protein kinase
MSPMSADPEGRIGTELAGFRIESVIGRGGMGVVYGAEQLRYDRKVALKLLAPELSHDPQFRERFELEWRTAARIEHPSIVPIYEAGEVEDGLYIAMRYIDGIDLRTLLAGAGPLAPERALDILSQVADALDAVHGQGLVHRDVKPANVLVVPGAGHEYAYLGDFGVAKQVRTESGLTQTGAFIGTVDYAAPEQLEGKVVDGRADVYALGCVLYQCLTGARPFEKSSDAATISAHLLEPPPSAHAANPSLPPELDRVIARALAKAPGDRFPSCRELVRAARAVLTGLPPVDAAGIPADAGDGGPPTLPSGAAAATLPSGAGAAPGGGRRRRGPAIALVVSAIAAIGVVLAILLTRGGTEAGDEAAPEAPATAVPPAATAVSSTGAETQPAPAEPPSGPFALHLGDVVAPGQPGEGAGEIAEPGEQDAFTYDAAGGEQIFLDVQPIDGECPVAGLSWRLVQSESGAEVFDSTIADCSEPFDEDGFTLEESPYTLTVYGAEGATGTYRFLLAPVAIEEFALELGDVVSPGEPGEGAGEIAAPAELDVFTFEAAGGERIFLDVQPIGDQCPVFDMGWKLTHLESGTEVFDEAIHDCAEPFGEDGFTLEDGTYTLVVYGAGGVTGTYRFALEQL